MTLLGSILYDPAVAVVKSTAAALGMTALDTTNLRLAFTVPASGKVLVRLMGCLHGATTYPSILLGVMSGATVLGRVNPMQSFGNTATGLANVEAEFVVAATPGAATWDAAYGVETLVAATGLKYGGPNNATANDAFGAFCFEVWDVSPDTRLTNLDTTVSSRSTYAGGAVASVTGAVGSVTGLNPANLDVAVSSRLAAASYVVPDNTGIAGIKTRTDNNLDVPVSSRSTYAGGDTSGVTTLLSRVPGVVSITGGKVDVNDKTGFALTVAQLTAIANEVEAQIITETDSEKVLTAITDKIAAVNPSLGGLTLAGIAAAVRTALATELARIDASISSRSVYAGQDSVGTATLLERLNDARATLLDNLTLLDVAISTRRAASGGMTVEQIAGAVWDEPAAVHTQADTVGAKLSTNGNGNGGVAAAKTIDFNALELKLRQTGKTDSGAKQLLAQIRQLKLLQDFSK